MLVVPLRRTSSSATIATLLASSTIQRPQLSKRSPASRAHLASSSSRQAYSPPTPTSAPTSSPTSHPTPIPAQPPPSSGPPRLIRHPPIQYSPHHPDSYPAPHYYVPPSPLEASVLIAKQRAARRGRSRLDSLPLFQFRSSLAEVDFDSPLGWSAKNPTGLSSGSIPASKTQGEPSASSSSSTITGTMEGPSSSAPTSVSVATVSSRATAHTSSRTTARRSAAKQLRHDHSDHDHGHAHSHNIFGGHSHSHDHASPEEADRLVAALKGKGDRGSNITLLGLFSNIVLCISKGIAGVLLNSASLVADAAHSLSDMFSDLVTLFCWKMSQKPPSQTHPLGYGKYETMGGLGVSIVLVGGAAGIGLHSWGLLLESLGPMLKTAPALVKTIGSWTGSAAHWGAGHFHDHQHHVGEAASAAEAAGGALDPNAMWFALVSVLAKEWLYRATLKIAKEENSSVLKANALHHRSDSLSSGVTFLAIGGSWLGMPVLDPLGGLLVAALIGKQGFELLVSALAELSDRGVNAEALDRFGSAMASVSEAEPNLVGWRDFRAVKSGVSTFIDVTLVLPDRLTISEARLVEDKVREALVEANKGVKEVRVHMAPENEQ